MFIEVSLFRGVLISEVHFLLLWVTARFKKTSLRPSNLESQFVVMLITAISIGYIPRCRLMCDLHN